MKSIPPWNDPFTWGSSYKISVNLSHYYGSYTNFCYPLHRKHEKKSKILNFQNFLTFPPRTCEFDQDPSMRPKNFFLSTMVWPQWQKCVIYAPYCTTIKCICSSNSGMYYKWVFEISKKSSQGFASRSLRSLEAQPCSD